MAIIGIVDIIDLYRMALVWIELELNIHTSIEGAGEWIQVTHIVFARIGLFRIYSFQYFSIPGK